MLGNLKAKFKKITAIALASAVTVATLATPSTTVKAADVGVNLNTTYQSIKGFGGMNHPVWIQDLTSSQVNTAFGNGDNQLGLNILRIHVDENKNNWSKELPTAKAAISKGAIVFATPWNPPSYMTEPITKNGKKTKRLKTNMYGQYAQYLNEFVKYMKNNGVNLYAISIQNEPDWGYEWTWWEPDEIYNFTRYYAKDIVGCKVMSAESFSYNKNYYNKVLNDPQAVNNIDIFGTHFYGTLERDMAYPLMQQKAKGKELWMTEVYVPDSNTDADVWPSALKVASNINGAMINGFQTYVWWYIRRSYSPIKENGSISKRGYCLAQYSKFIRPGYQRVDAPTNQNGLAVSAYKGNGKAVIVVINDKSYTINQTFAINGGNAKSVTRYRTSASENLAKSSVPVNSNKFNANFPANSVSTFVCDLENNSSANKPAPAPSQDNNNAAILKDGWYYIKNVHAQKYLQVAGNVGKNNANVELSKGTGVPGQKWYLKNVGNGYVTLKSALGDFNLDVTGGKNTDGANMIIYNAYAGTPQQFSLRKTSQNMVYNVLTKTSNLTKCLDDYNFQTQDGANVIQWTFNATANQQWVFEPTNY